MKLLKLLGLEGKHLYILPTTKGKNFTELHSKKGKYPYDTYMGSILYSDEWKAYVLVDLHEDFQMSLSCLKEAFEMTEKYWVKR